ncbi:MAG: tol-pal system protein YbgF [Pseudomonadota bacterium]
MSGFQHCWTLSRVALAATAAGCLLVAGYGPATAQTKPKPQANTQANTQAKADETAQLRKRVEQLEEQLIDIQVVLGTLETLAKSGARSGPPSPNAGGTAAGGTSFTSQSGSMTRMDALETQLRALASQVQQLSNGRPQGNAVANNQPPPAGVNRSQQFGVQPSTGFGSTTVQPEAQTRGQQQGSLATPAQPGAAAGTSSSFLPSSSGGNAQGAYESAYGLLLQQDYGAAQKSFADFLKRHPRSPLAGNAQYWLGETYYVRGEYKFAAGAFLKGYRQYSRGNKAPDSLLKLAMSLDKLGQRAAACSSLSELGQKYPQAAAHVRRRASQERSRLRC